MDYTGPTPRPNPLCTPLELSPIKNVTPFERPIHTAALDAIRFLTGPIGALMLIGAIAVAYFYPFTRARHERILRLLEKRRAREAAKAS